MSFSSMTSMSSADKYERERIKHGEPLTKAQQVKAQRKKEGLVKSWMEVFVLVNDKMGGHKPHLGGGQHAQSAQDLHAAAATQKNSPLQSPQSAVDLRMVERGAALLDAAPSPSQPANSPGAGVAAGKSPLMDVAIPPVALDPAKKNVITRENRGAFDAALEEQTRIEMEKMEQLLQEQLELERKMTEQKAKLAAFQAQQALAAQAKAQQQQQRSLQQQQQQQQQQIASPQLAVAPPTNAPAPAAALGVNNNNNNANNLNGASVKEMLVAFFKKHEREALLDGRLEAVYEWTKERGVDKLCAMLREQYGEDLFGRRNVENGAVDEIQADRIARRLLGFYRAHNVHEMMNWHEVLKIGRWACKRGEAKLNKKLRDKYNDDLDSYAQRVVASVEPRLRRFYEKHNPEVLKDDSFASILLWAVSNGISDLNNMLYTKYGEDLDGRKRTPGNSEERQKQQQEQQQQQPPTTTTAPPGGSGSPPQNSAGKTAPDLPVRKTQGRDPRAVLQRELTKMDGGKLVLDEQGRARGSTTDPVEKRKRLLIAQLASFLEAKDPDRLEKGGLVPLVNWALPRSNRQLDDLLNEEYADDLDSMRLRELKFAQGEAPADEDYGPASRAAASASVATEDEFNRAEVRSMRTGDDKKVLVPMQQAAEETYVVDETVPEPDF